MMPSDNNICDDPQGQAVLDSINRNQVLHFILFKNDNSEHDLYDGNTFNNINVCDSVYLTVDEVNKFIACKTFIAIFCNENCRSILRNFNSVKILISNIKHPMTAIAITETWLKQ